MGTEAPTMDENQPAATKDLSLVRGQVAPRARQLLLNSTSLFAAVFAVIVAGAIDRLPIGSMKISDVVTNGFTFASITLGACFSAIVLSLGLPGAERLRKWSSLEGTTKSKSALSDLVFVLVWAALSQVAVIITCAAALIFGGEHALGPTGMHIPHRVGLFLGSFVFFYALLELIIVVRTLSQVGVVIIFEERARDDTA